MQTQMYSNRRRRNFGFGRSMRYAAKRALATAFGMGHYGSRASYLERFRQFIGFARSRGVRDTRSVTRDLIDDYCADVRRRVEAVEIRPSYARNLISTVNVVMEALRGDSKLRVRPSEVLGRQSRQRKSPPAGIDLGQVQKLEERLRARGEDAVADVVILARHFGLRRREASLLDAREAIQQAIESGAINVTRGTKGGRGRYRDRWVLVSKADIVMLQAIAARQGSQRNLVPPGSSVKQWFAHLERVYTEEAKPLGLGKLHDLRAAWACDRYRTLSGHHARVVVGHPTAPRDTDEKARAAIADEMGHNRADVVGCYIGARR